MWTRSLLALLLLATACHRATLRAASSPKPSEPHITLLYREAWDANRRGDAAAALERLRRLDAEGWSVPFDPSDFPGLAEGAEFREVAARVAARQPATPHAPLAATLPERGLIAEGIAADARDGTLYVGSIRHRKILRVAAGGRVSDAVAPGAGGLGRVLGLKVDAAGGLLWAAANDRDAPSPRGGVYAFDLATGALRRSAVVEGRGHLLNDLVVAEDGTVFVTDSEAGQVLRLDQGATTFAPLVEPGRFLYANGIALVDGRLVVADAVGLWDVPRQGGAARQLDGPARFPLGGIDGLAADGRTLLAVQNALGTPRIVRLVVAPAAARVVEASVLEAGNPGWHIPTTGALAGGAFFYIGNSHIDGWSDEKVAPSAMQETRIYRLPLP